MGTPWPWRRSSGRAVRSRSASGSRGARNAGRRRRGCVLLLGAGRRLGRERDQDDREIRRSGRRVGPQRTEGVGHQRRDRRRARGDRIRGSGARLTWTRGLRRADERGQRHIGRLEVSKHGLRASHTADVHLDDCRVPAGYVLGGRDKLEERIARVREGKRSSSQAAMQTFEASRPTVGAQALGIARAAYEYALEYSKEREQFGRKIIENQAIAFTLARMKLEIDAARLLVWRASWMGRAGHRFENAEGSMSKLKSGEVAVWVTERAIQILGGNGYTREYPVERWHRDEKIYDIFEGTAQIQQLVIARAISGLQIA